MKNALIAFGLLACTIAMINCKKGATPKPYDEINFSMNVDGTKVETFGTALWDINSSSSDSGVLTIFAGKDEYEEPEFTLVWQGKDIKLNTPMKIMEDVFGNHIVYSYKGTDYDTRATSGGTQLGTITFTGATDNGISGTFQLKMPSSSGKTIAITDGVFNVVLKRF
jgi:hypothetical protein